MRKVCPILIGLMLSISVKAQRMSDTIKVIVEDRIEMKIITEDFHNLKTDSVQLGVKSQLEQFQAQLPSIKSYLIANKAEQLIFEGDGTIRLKAGEEQAIFIIGEEGVTNSGTRDHAIIIHPAARIEIVAADITEIIEINLSEHFQSMVKALPEKTDYAMNLLYQVKADELTVISEEAIKSSAGDVIELTVGAGANLYQGQWLGEFQTKLELKFFNKNVMKHNPYLSYSWLYDFSTPKKMNINGFLNIGYQWDLEAEKEDETLFGIEAGWLVNRSANLFEKNTWRLGLNWSPANGITVSPQIYVEGVFQKVQPGVRFTFGL